MHTKTIQTIASVAFAALIGIQAQAQKQSAVSIIFTDIDRLTAIDTVIPSGESSLENLLNAHSLQSDQVHTIHMNSNAMNWVEKEGEEHRVMVIEAKESISGEASVDEEKHEVRVIKIDGGNMEDLTEEERVMVEKQIEEARKHKADGKEEMIIEKRVVIQKDGEENGENLKEEKEIQIEVTVEDGKEIIVAYENGKRLSDEEAQQLLQEQKIAMDENPNVETEKKMIFIAKDEEIRDGEVRIERREFKSKDMSDMKAIVIVKELEGDPKVGYNPMNVGSLHLYPNPAQQNVQAKFDGVKGSYSLSITNLAGQTVWSENGSAEGMLQQKIDLDGFAPGTYIITLDHDQGLSSQKLVVE